jgi:geranylgeranyl diphosphate synthase, type II
MFIKTTFPIDTYIEEKILLVETKLNDLVKENKSLYNILLQAARYSLLSGGKRLRPLLTLAAAEALNIPNEITLQPACALEFIHTYSLIHDDLPCMDDDDFRRGKPSLHKAFPESHAVLAGDYLLTYAFEILADSPSLSAQQKIELVRILAQHSGSEGMIGGQIIDIEAEGLPIEIDYLQQMHEKKTGALITASLLFAGIIANADSQTMLILKKFGYEIGLAFQIVDDVLDVTTHKNSDAKNHKTTYITLLGIDKARDLADQRFKAALELLNQLPFDTTALAALAKKLVDRNK